MKPDAEQVAAVLDRAHDELLVRGWCKYGLESASGEHCALGAISEVCEARRGSSLMWPDTAFAHEHWPLAFHAASALTATFGFVPEWNDAVDRNIDDVLDGFRITAKALRNGELEVA